MRRVAPPTLPPNGFTPSLPAHDLTATRDFYVRDLGLTAHLDEPGRLLVRVGGGLLEFRQEEACDPAGDGLRLTFASPDPGALLKRLRSLGVEVDVPPAPAGARRQGGEVRFYARDPDGRTVAFAQALAPGAQ